MKAYKAAKGAQFTDDDAEKLGLVLEKIGFSAKPEQIIAEARPKNSPIHHLFEWDDSEAAEKYRRWQARSHTNHLQIIIKTEQGQEVTRAFHSVTITSDDGSRERAYCHMDSVAENPDLREQVIAKALAELNGWRARYAQYKRVFSEVFEAISVAQQKAPKRAKRRSKVA